jgi:hypothetical protein
MKTRIIHSLNVLCFVFLTFFSVNVRIFRNIKVFIHAVGPCHHDVARPQVADTGTAFDKEGSCE